MIISSFSILFSPDSLHDSIGAIRVKAAIFTEIQNLCYIFIHFLFASIRSFTNFVCFRIENTNKINRNKIAIQLKLVIIYFSIISICFIPYAINNTNITLANERKTLFISLNIPTYYVSDYSLEL